MSEANIKLVHIVATSCAWLIRDGGLEHFPESGEMDDSPYVGSAWYYYAPEDVNRAYDYLKNRANRWWESKIKTTFPAAAINMVGNGSVEHFSPPQQPLSGVLDLALPAFLSHSPVHYRKLLALAAIREWAHKTDPTTTDSELDILLEGAEYAISRYAHGRLAHRFAETRMYVWSKLHDFGRDSAAIRVEPTRLATRTLSDAQRSIYFANSCKDGTEELYGLIHRIYKGLRWQTPDETIEGILGEAVRTVIEGDAEGFQGFRGEIEALLPY